MTISRLTPIWLASASVVTLVGPAVAQELPGLKPAPDVEYSPYLQEEFPNQVLFGDTHLHTAYSADAGLVGATLGPDDAYRFAKGEEVISSMGVPARLQRPLDFLVVTDHAENLGLPAALEEDIRSSRKTSGAARSPTFSRRGRSMRGSPRMNSGCRPRMKAWILLPERRSGRRCGSA